MVVLVTGGCGYVGSLLAREIPNHHNFEGVTVRLLNRMPGDSYIWSVLGTFPKNQKYELIIGDITRKDDLKKALKDVEVVFHLAAPGGSRQKQPGAEELIRTTVIEGTKNFVEECINSNLERFINTSSCGVYVPLPQAIQIVTEETPCSPSGAYRESKLEAELYLLRRAKETGTHITSLRISAVTGFNIPMRMYNTLHSFTLLAALGTPLPVWRKALGIRRPFVDIRDAARAFLFAATNSKCKGETFNVVNFNDSSEGLVAQIKKLIPDTQMQVTDQCEHYQSDFAFPADGSKLISRGFNYNFTEQDIIRDLLDNYNVFYRTRLPGAKTTNKT